jgi:hypothetical protein
VPEDLVIEKARQIDQTFRALAEQVDDVDVVNADADWPTQYPETSLVKRARSFVQQSGVLAYAKNPRTQSPQALQERPSLAGDPEVHLVVFEEGWRAADARAYLAEVGLAGTKISRDTDGRMRATVRPAFAFRARSFAAEWGDEGHTVRIVYGRPK